MPGASPPAFRFWRFFFSLRGRASRLPYALFVVGSQGLLEGLALMNGVVGHGFAHPDQAGVYLVYTALGMAKFLLVWPQFALISKRLHDLGSGFLPALTWFLPLTFSLSLAFWPMHRVANPLATPSSLDVAIALHARTVLSVLDIALLLAAVVLAIMPGTKGANRFGPDPRQDASAADIF